MTRLDDWEKRRLFRRIGIAGAVFATLLGVGTAAFAAVAGEGGEEAFYRALGAFTTASFVAEPDSSRERAIAATLTVAGGLFYLVLVAGVVQTLLRHVFADLYAERRMKADIAKLEGHYVVCGYGRVGRAVTRALLEQQKQVVVVELEPNNCLDLERHDDFRKNLYLIRGDADDSDVLHHARLDRAAGLVACVGSDAENVYIALAARRCHPDVSIVARASDEDAEKNLRAAAHILDNAITPYTSAGRALADAVVSVGRNGAS